MSFGTARADVLEKDLQTQVVELARVCGYEIYHTHDSRRSQHGWPDLALLGRRLVMVELKREKTKTTAPQKRWLRKLHAAGVETYVVRPRNLDDLARVLGGRQSHPAMVEARERLVRELEAEFA